MTHLLSSPSQPISQPMSLQLPIYTDVSVEMPKWASLHVMLLCAAALCSSSFAMPPCTSVPTTWEENYPCGIDTSLRITNVTVSHSLLSTQIMFTVLTSNQITGGAISACPLLMIEATPADAPADTSALMLPFLLFCRHWHG